PRRGGAGRLPAFRGGPGGGRARGTCLDPMAVSGPTAPVARTASGAADGAVRAQYAQAVVDWWLPQCTLAHNAYNDPREVLGPPDAVSLGGGDYPGVMRPGPGRHRTVRTGATVAARARAAPRASPTRAR